MTNEPEFKFPAKIEMAFFSKQMMIQLTPLVSKSKSKKYKHPKKKRNWL